MILLEADGIASGSSGKPLGGVRVQSSDRANIELGLRSLHACGRFAEDFGIGIGIGLRQVGHLFALRDPAEVELALQNELGAVQL